MNTKRRALLQRLHIRGIFPAHKRTIAIVGTRKATPQAQVFARTCAYELAKQGICVISGLAHGIDAQAHRGALEARGTTCAVLGHGLDRIFPHDHKPLAARILANGGALLSEYPADTPPYPKNFLERNKVLSDLCEALIVIEAPRRSGALYTGMYTLRQKRPLFVVPGNITTTQYVGSHMLIRKGGRLIASLEDLLQDLKLPRKETEPQQPFR